MKRTGKKLTAWLLAAMIGITSAQLPTVSIYAQEQAQTLTDLPADNIGADIPENPATPPADGEETGGSDGASEIPAEQPGTPNDPAETPDDNPGIPESPDDKTESPDDGQQSENPGDSSETPSDKTETPDEEDDISDEGQTETPDEEGDETLDEELLETSDIEIPEAVSANALSADKPDNDLIEITLDLDGVYQFGGAPTEPEPPSFFTAEDETDPANLTAAGERLYQGMLQRTAKIELSDLNIDLSLANNLLTGILNEHPDLFYLKKQGNSIFPTSSGSIASFNLVYDDALYAERDAVNDIALTALAAAGDAESDLQKAIILHDYLAVNCEYDTDNYNHNTIPDISYTIYGVFKKRIAVCQGYALAYKYLLNQCGINCYMVTSDNINHAWNMIELNGNYYQVDVTWDDPSWNLIGRACHNNMFRSDNAFTNHLKNGEKDWMVTKSYYITDPGTYTATDTTYDNAFWAGSTAPLVFDGDTCYYTAYDTTSHKASINKKSSALDDISASGSIFHEINGDGYQGVFSGLFQTGGRLYYNDYNKICSIAMDGTDDETVFPKNESQTLTGHIYDCAFYPEPPDNPGNPYKIHYSLHNTPNLTAAEEILVVDTDLPQPEDPIPARLTCPSKTTYLTGETLDLTGGKVDYPSDSGRKTENLEDLAADKISGFDSSTAGIREITVTYAEGKTLSFDVLIVETPTLENNTVLYGQTLGSIDLSGYNTVDGTYAWKDGTTVLNTEGEQTFKIVFTPKDLTKFQPIELEMTLHVLKAALTETGITLENDSLVYNGDVQTPQVTVTHTVQDGQTLTLIKDRDYTLTYENNKDAGTATITIEGKGAYTGRFVKTFTIEKAALSITAQDKTIRVGDPLPAADSYQYTTSGLCGIDILISVPTLTCAITSTKTAAEYDIVPSGADAGPNYDITYVNGKLTVAANAAVYTVRFDVQGHGTAPAAIPGLEPGSKVTKPADPTAEGYRFDGWFKEAACTHAWLFDTDTVQADITLYAKWTKEEDRFILSEIPDLIYTGKAQKPALSVSYGKTPLKAGRDYTLRYYNNVNVNAGGVQGDSSSFNASLPYVEVTGKDNYSAVLRLNFNILPRPIGDGSEKPADGVKLKVTDQFATANKAAKPFSSIRSVTAMRIDKDFSLRLTVVSARDQSGTALPAGTELADASIPAGCSGEFLLTITGLGNYTGSIVKRVYITDKVHLLKNMTITLGKNLKNIPFQGSPIELTPSETLTPDTFIVKYKRTVLRYGRDYTVRYQNNDRVGKAELIAVGIGEYAGTKSAFFNIKGISLSAGKIRVTGIENKVYTGLAQTQDGMSLVYGAGTANERQLTQDIDYTVDYTKNINKGTATMTFKGLAQAGFKGSFKKTFKITPALITDTTQADAMENLSFRFNKNGVKPVDEIVLTNSHGLLLQNKKDYTLKYKNNKNVAEKTDKNPPTVIIKGKGNYTGELKVFFTIRKADFDTEEDGLKFTAISIPYLPDKPADYAYTPVINVRDGNTKLRLGADYTITYVENTQADFEGFVKTLTEDPKDVHPIPRAIITPTDDSPYLSSHTVLLPIYITAFTQENLEVNIVGETYYTGGQVRPKVEVFYRGENGKILLEEGNHKDYVVVYGTNTQVGKNKGSLTIHGTVPYYGGYVTLKFDIQKRSFAN